MMTARTATLLRLLTILATKGDAAAAPDAATVTAVEIASGSMGAAAKLPVVV